jgi:asparagine synthase (glutamine-hydrolysing)
MSHLVAGVFEKSTLKGHRTAVVVRGAHQPDGTSESSGPLTITSSNVQPCGVAVRPNLCGFHGYVANLPQICNRLSLPLSTPPAAAVSELTRRDGLDAISQLRGAFILAVWDDDVRRGVIATDHLGAGGLFFWSDGRRLLFGSEIRAVLDLLSRTPSPDDDTLTRWLANDAPGAKTLYEGIFRLPGGEMIELVPGAWSSRRYWQLDYAPAPRGSADEYAVSVRRAAAGAVRSRLARGETTGILLSGGLDSSSIAALARGSGESLHGYSAVFPDDPEADESSLIELFSRSAGIPTTTLAVGGGSMLAPALEYLGEWRVPSVSPNLLFATPLVREAAHGTSSVLLDGEGGDELFGFSPYVFADLLMHGRLVRALRLASRIPGLSDEPRGKVLRSVLREWALKGALPHAVHRAARRWRPEHYGAPWLTRAAARRHGRSTDRWRWKRIDGPRWWASLADHVTESRQRSGAHDFLRHKSTLGGLQGRHPYLEDVDLTVQMLSLPPELSFDPTFDRPILRRAMKGLMPEEIRLRQQKSYFNVLLHRVLVDTDRDALLGLLHDRAEVAAYVRVDVVRSYLQGAPTRPATWGPIVWRAATAECWLRTLDDPAYPEKALAEWPLEPPRLEVHRARTSAAPETRGVRV